MREVIVRASTLPGVFGVLFNAALAAVGTSVALRFVLVATRALSPAQEWWVLAITTVVLGIPSAIWYKRLYSWRFWVYCVSFVCMSVACMVGVAQLIRPIWNTWGVTLTPYLGTRLLPILPDKIDFGIEAFLGTMAAWGLSRLVRGPIKIDYGISCPTCNYCLVGAEELRCPECGCGFTFEQLGVTREQAAKYRDTQGRIARPIVDDREFGRGTARGR